MTYMYTYILFLLCPLFVVGQSLSKDVNSLFQQKEYIEAEQLLSTHLKTHPKDYQAIELLGDAYGYQKKWDDAITTYYALVEYNDKNANYHYKYGGALGIKALSVSRFRALGMIGDIKAAFNTAAKLDATHIEVRWALVELYMQLPGILGGSKKRSLQFANELESLSKVDGYLAKGYIYEYDNNPELAENYYKKAIETGGSLTCFEKLTNFYANENRPENAIANIESAQTKHKNQRNALHYQIGKVSAEYDIQLDKGLQCLNTYIKNHSAKDGVPIEWAYYRLAQIHKHQNNKNEALKWIDEALSIRADFKQALEEKEIISRL